MEQLKKCPFCGGEVKLLAIAGEPYPPTYEVELEKITKDSDDICFVHCPTCNANWHKQVRIDSFPLDTITAWNTRKPTEQIVERLEGYKNEYLQREQDAKDAGLDRHADLNGIKAYMMDAIIEIVKEELNKTDI